MAPVADINNVASINVNAANNAAAGAVINASEFTDVAKIAVTNGTNGQFVNITNAQLDTVYSIEKARSVTVDIQSFADASGLADVVSLNAVSAGNETADATFDLSGATVEAIALTTTGTNFLTVAGGANVEAVTVTGSGANEITFNALAATAVIDASATTADQVYDVSGFASNLTVKTGAGDDVVDFGTRLVSKDTFNGGAGDNTLIATINSGTLVRPTGTNVQNMVVDFGAAGGTLQADLITGTTNYDISGSAGNVNVTKVASTVADLVIDATNAGTFAFGYASGSANALDIAIGDIGTAKVDGVAVNVNGLATLTTVQTVTINSIGDAANTFGSVGGLTAASATSLTLNTDSKTSDLTVGNLTAGKLTELNLNATEGDIAVGTLAAASKLETLNVDTTGAADVTVGAIGAGTAAYSLTDVTVNVDSGDLNLGAITTDGGTATTVSSLSNVSVTLKGGTSATNQTAIMGAIDATQGTLAAYTLVAGDYANVGGATLADIGTVKADSIGSVDLTIGASSQAQFDGFITDTLSGINAVIGKSSTLTIDLIDDVASAGGVAVVGDIVATGAGAFVLSNVDAASVSLFDTSNLTGTVTASLANVGTGTTFVLGNGATTLSATAGADNITAGTANDTITGNAGNDTIDISAGGVDRLIHTYVTTDGNDAITGFSASGLDVFVFGAGVTTGGDADKIELTAASVGATLANTNAGAVVGAVTALAAGNYTEFAGGTAGFTTGKVNVITTTGYASATAAVLASGGTAAEAGFVVFYNTTTSEAEMHYVLVNGGATALTTDVTVANFTDITLTGVADLSASNFAVIAV